MFGGEKVGCLAVTGGCEHPQRARHLPVVMGVCADVL